MIAEKHEQKAAELAQILKGLDAPQRFDQLWQWSRDFFIEANPSPDQEIDSEQVPIWRYALSENRWEKQWLPGPDTCAAWRAFQMKGWLSQPASEAPRRRPRG